ncbi:hypothetical protein [Streptomyces sp. NPDC050263]|uniref:hypothetical protein n=1 Tax=Streptomyces sp. NPDC050263 TaxID=3155037 RepID=UPI003447295C
MPVRGASPSADSTGTLPFVRPTLSPEALAADQPSLDILRRVRRGLDALPESD